MSRTIEQTIYKFDELSDEAKEKAREWWRQCENADFTDLLDRDDFEKVAKILGIEFSKRYVNLMNGKTRGEPDISYSGFWSEGDGASWQGSYSYAKGSCKAIRTYAPNDKDLHSIADQLFALQRKYFYRITVDIYKRSSLYSHSGTMQAHAYVGDNDANDSIREDILDIMRSFADWIYSQLEKEYEYIMSDENVDENIRCNEYEFDEDGDIA